MSNTHFNDNHEMIVKNRANSYSLYEENDFRRRVLNYANVGATSLFMTVEDLTRWLLNLKNGSVGGKPVIEQFQS